MFGIAGGFGLVFVIDYFDKSIKTIEALKGLGMPVLAILPAIETQEEKKIRKKEDIRLLTYAGLYALCLVTFLIMEYLGITIIDDFLQRYLI